MTINYLDYSTIDNLKGIIHLDAMDKGCDVEWTVNNQSFDLVLHMDEESVKYHVPNFEVLVGQMDTELNSQGGLVADTFWDMMNEYYRD